MSRSEDYRNYTPSSLTWKAYVDLQLAGGALARQPLLDQHVVIGRSPNLQLTLDHDTVSRRHAELFCDPFGRWWIRDLGSTNGTVVNGERVAEKVLQPGDRIGIGDYSLFFQVLVPVEKRSRPRLGPLESDEEPSIVESDESLEDPTNASSPSWVRSLRDLDPPKIAASHLSTLMDFSRRLLGIESPDERLNALCQLMISSEFHASLSLAMRVRPGEMPGQTSTFQVLSGPHRPEHIVGEDPPYISRRVIRSVQQTGQPALASNLAREPQSLELTLSAEVVPLSAVACPLGREGNALDLLYVNLPPQFGSVEWLALIALAAEAFQQSESAWAAREHEQAHLAIERELETARQIQQALVPANVVITGLDVELGFEPCKWVGGDYVDAIPMADGRLLCAVADVCGKGLQAALVTFSVHTMMRALADTGRPLAEITEKLNRHLCTYLPNHSFVTMVAMAICPRTGELECINAGHLPPLLVSRAGDVRLLQSAENSPVGVSPSFSPFTQREIMREGELLVLYTDGLTELRSPNREMLGQDAFSRGLARLYQRAHARDLPAIAGDLTSMLSDFSEDQVPEDDRAFLLARRK
jgi:phosphoserine phosphatase RsbU/P